MSIFEKEYSSDVKVVGIVKNHTQEFEAKTNLCMHEIQKTLHGFASKSVKLYSKYTCALHHFV